ncbi:MAG: hypothetical protein KM312_10815 [Hydrogenibacillus schlegelii]|uniref:Uncharacterized protein n=1 Tax=Hydrogenibacillus schlegelii TaxID=1484 RepID=A0A947GCE6_HYDSH|nr:hypothetical protein [Hydrogenibacillus schlegelii]MBT9283111.1 hypothetical protein [Hydrogenibacillus schlegelii]
MFKSRIANKLMLFLVISFSLIMLVKSIALARNIERYDLIIPPFGQTAFTAPTSKVNYSRGVDNNSSIGGGYAQYTAIYRGNTLQVTEKVEIRSGDRVLLPYLPGQNLPGEGYRLGHTSKLTTYVRVQAQGTWSPDEY